MRLIPRPRPDGPHAGFALFSARLMSVRLLAPWILLMVLAAGSAVAADGWKPGPAGLSIQARLREKASPLLADGSPRLAEARLRGKAAPESLQAVVLLCEFADSLLYGRDDLFPGDFPRSRQTDFYYAAHDSLYYAHLLQDVADYFADVSGHRFGLGCVVEATVAHLDEPMSFYGNHPDRGEQQIQLAADVVAALDDEVDFSRFDTVILVHAGAGEETDILNNSPEQIFSTYLGPEDFSEAVTDSILDEPYIPTNDLPSGQGVDHVLVLPEGEFQDPFGSFQGYFGSLGVYCFEVGLRLGMLSLSDFTPPGFPDSQGIGEFGLMGYGLFVGAGYIPDQPCAFNKQLMGWLEPYAVDPGEGAVHDLTPAERPADPGAAARVALTGQEYWLLEYRLQDPDGNGIFTHPDDLNHNHIPDFYDVDSDSGDGTPTGFFDPLGADGLPGTGDEDVRERLAGAEWDFFMSENSGPARQGPDAVKGAGSGIYIWHVDEGVIREAFGADRNLFNADPQRKSVDLEEADGIQDLDSSESSPYILGGDDDSFRGEGSHVYGEDLVVGTVFGPDTEPGTETAGGARSGILFDGFTNVVVDSAYGDPPRILYADTMSFRCTRLAASGAAPVQVAEVVLPGVDLRGRQPLAIDLNPQPGGAKEIVLAGLDGAVYAFNADLTEHVDHDGDPATSEPLVVGTDADGEPVSWTGPAAAGDLDGDGLPEIVLTAAGGLYAFNGEDGSEVADGDGDPDSRGLLAPLTRCLLPPVLLSRDGFDFAPDLPVVACVLDEVASGTSLRFLDGTGLDAAPPVLLDAQGFAAAPLLLGNILYLVRAGEDPPDNGLWLVRWSPPTDPSDLGFVTLPAAPVAWPPVAGQQGNRLFVATPTTAGVRVLSWPLGENPGAGSQPLAWAGPQTLVGPLGPGLCYAVGGLFTRVTLEGVPQTGWPVHPRPGVQAPDSAAGCTPLNLVRQGRTEYLFQSRDGRLYLYDQGGRLQDGWPLAGPGAAAATPLLLDLHLHAEQDLDLVAIGTTARITGLDPGQDALETVDESRLSVWSGLGEAGSGWPMWRGSPWRSGAVPVVVPLPGAPPALLFAGSHICYPSPLRQGPLHVRAEAGRDAAARVVVYNLEGEEVSTAGPQAVRAGEPFEITLPLAGIASGLYVCRLELADGRASETSIVPFAVAR